MVDKNKVLQIENGIQVLLENLEQELANVTGIESKQHSPAVLRAKIRLLNSKVEKLEKQLGNVPGDRTEAAQEITRLQAVIDSLKLTAEGWEDRFNKVCATLQGVDGQLAALKEKAQKPPRRHSF